MLLTHPIPMWKPGPERVSGSIKVTQQIRAGPSLSTLAWYWQHKLSYNDVLCRPAHSHTCSASSTADAPHDLGHGRGLCPFYCGCHNLPKVIGSEVQPFSSPQFDTPDWKSCELGGSGGPKGLVAPPPVPCGHHHPGSDHPLYNFSK